MDGQTFRESPWCDGSRLLLDLYSPHATLKRDKNRMSSHCGIFLAVICPRLPCRLPKDLPVHPVEKEGVRAADSANGPQPFLEGARKFHACQQIELSQNV